MTGIARFARENWLTLLVLVGLLVAYLALRSSPSDIASAEAFMSDLQQGQPTVVEFYSNF